MKNILAASELLLSLIINAKRIASMIQFAHAAGRDLDNREWAEILEAADSAEITLQDSINKARAAAPQAKDAKKTPESAPTPEVSK